MTTIAEGLFTDETLIGGRNRESGRIVFPCPADSERYEAVTLPSRGTIWSWTVQRFPPKSPPYAADVPFAPFALAYVELPGAVIVETRLEGFAFDELKVGLPCAFRTVDFGGRTAFAFGPVESDDD
ncbi:Zn-ribbon domain-containing OB-fold protein [Sandaracinobacteroides saxicola]|uniref:OB-fold domain-containing protein n=1 Tax=Sandaracinobacteroides saxicola TaxID=2759707 RepID=A0A7G5IEY9_9SPHN|nr:OB-fold domain-containing protein [Sandaracinobacteroides saxicola]QMW21931.1 OB-fold domain-containing protein [Sandaracinobacteroides saxicola]